jgi:5-methylcytosine-specific restriction endonuclease McrA
MRHRSKKKEAEYRLRRPLVARLLEERPFCEACPVFAKHDEKVTYIRRPSVDIHEIVRRSQGGSILKESNLLAVCRDCHRRIGNHPQLAFDLGLAKPGWTLNQKNDDDTDRS